METEAAVHVIELVARSLAYCAVAVIAFSFPHASIRALLQFGQKKKGVWEDLRLYIGKALQLSLEFLIAADIIRTVIIRPTREGILTLGLLIVVRTFLSWSITVELEGCWPWQIAHKRKG